MNQFPDSDENDAIGKWLLSLPFSTREKLFRLADYMNGSRRREVVMPVVQVERYHDGVCEFPGGKQSAEAEKIAELLARAIVNRKIEERKAA